jgi:hypothetical protein
MMRYFTLSATIVLFISLSLSASAGLLAGRGKPGSLAQTIASITPTTCSFTSGTQNGAVCNIAVTMSPATPAPTAALTLTGTNSGGFHLVGAGCPNVSLGSCTIVQSTGAAGTQAGTYNDVSVVATQTGISNSPRTQAVTLTGTAAIASGPGLLHVGTTNPRYFATQDGAGVYLTGNHTWTSGQSFANLGPFSFTAMVDYMATLNVNFIRHWDTWFATVDVLSNLGAITTPLPFSRSGTCCANDGGNKFNLTSLNQAYFDKVKTEVRYAASKGMYIMPLLFNLVEYASGGSWATDYWNGANNTNGTTTTYATAIEGGDPTLVALQQAYLRKFLDTLATETNVLYEISNELGQNHNTTAVYTWQEGMVSLIHSYEAAQGYLHHPVGIEYTPSNNASIAASPADFIIPYDFQADAAIFNFGKPSMLDTDHYFGIGGGTDWWWKGFTRGNLMISMDDMESTGLTGNYSLAGDSRVPAMLQNRPAITQTRTLATMMDMTRMVPHPELTSTGYALADTANGQYIVYAGSGGTISVNLSASPPPPTLSISANPSSPSVNSTDPSGTLVSTLTAAWSDNTPFAGSYLFAAPNFNDGGLFTINGNTVRTQGSLSGVGGTVQNITIGATDTSPVTLTAQWLNTATGALSASTNVSGGSTQNFTSPYGSTPAVLVIIPPAGTTISGISLAPVGQIATTACSFTAGTANGTVCDITVTMRPSTPASTAALTLTGTNSGVFYLAGTGCSNVSLGTCSIKQSSAVGGTSAGIYTDVSVVATQAGVSNSPFSQAMTLTGTPPPSIGSISSSPSSFIAQTLNHDSTVGTLTASVNAGSFNGAFALATATGCPGTNNASFAITGSTLKVGASDVTTAQSYNICVRATDASFSNSPFFQPITIVGTAPGQAGTALTTATYTNYSGSTLPAGTPISFGQAFRYGDVMPGTYPLIRDASTHTPLAGQQWDEIATWCSHTPGGACTTGAAGFNGSWRHAVWAAWLPNSLANGASIQLEFVTASGTYSQTSKQALSVLCSGAASHDLKIHLSDVRGQADTVRDSGDATFRVCDNIANVGRDAPRHTRAGNVYDEYTVSGMFVYATSGRQDPLLYPVCNIDIFTKASDGVSPGDVRWMCWINNSWMNVAAGTTGNAGNIGPVGFANDPQSISYKPEVLDGATSVLNWSGLDASVASGSNPIQPVGSVGCYGGWGDAYCMNVPTASGVNSWYAGQAVRVACGGTCPAGMTTDKLYYVAPVGEVGTQNLASTYYSVLLSPNYTYGPTRFMTSSQGTGTTNFGFRVQQYHWTSIPLFDQTGQTSWSPFGSATRVTRKVYPSFTTAEKQYWEQSGVIMPLNLSQPVHAFAPSPNVGHSPYYNPNTIGNVIGGMGGGDRPDLGIISEWAAQAFIVGGEANWDYSRLFSLGNTTYGAATILNEATGRIPAINNGPPNGPGGNGVGGSYASLGAPRNQVAYSGLGEQDMLDPPTNLPSASFPANGGQWTSGTYISHMPSFNGITYQIFGDRHWLDAMRFRGNADYAQQRTGPGPELGQGYLRDNNAKFTDGNTYHYYGLLIDCCQGRGQAWMTRDITYPAAFGGDNDIERSYYDDILVENRNYYPMFLRFKDGPSQAAPNNTNFSTSIAEPTGYYEGMSAEPFIETYLFDSAWVQLTWLHEPIASTWLKQWQRYVEGNCGSRLAGAMPYYCFDYYYTYAINNGSDGSVTSQQGSTGLYSNGVDASDFGIIPTVSLLTGGQWAVSTYLPTAGDQVMHMWGYHGLFSPGPIDQLAGNRYYSIMTTNNSTDPRTFYIQCTSADHTAFPSQCPVAGQAFTGYTSGGTPISNSNSYTLKLRLTYDNTANTGVGYSSINYMDYGGQKIIGLKIAGYNVANSLAAWDGPRLGGYNDSRPINNWDRTVVIPGLPTAVNSIP